MERFSRMLHSEIPRISQGTKKAWVKFINPQDNSAWYVTEFDGKDLCYGLMVGNVRVWGYFSLRELALMFHEQGIAIEMDPNWVPEDIE